MNNAKKLLVISVSSVLLIGGANIISMATTGKTITDGVRLRQEPNSNSIVLDLIPDKGDQLEVIEDVGEWSKVKYNKMTGYVHNDCLEVEKDVEEEKQEENVVVEEPKEETEEKNTEQNEENNVEEKQEEIKQENANNVKYMLGKSEKIYLRPLISSIIVNTFDKNTEVKVLQKVNNWAYIEINNQKGWIPFSRLVQDKETEQITSSVPDLKEDEEEKLLNKTGYVNADGINFRKAPNTESGVISVLYINTKITILTEEGDWYKISYKDDKGYIMKKYISDSEIKTTSRSSGARTVNVDLNAVSNAAQSGIGAAAAEYAKQFVGCSYVYGGASPSGFDCSGLVMYIYNQLGVSLPHSASRQESKGTKVTRDSLQPGDLLFFTDYRTNQGIGHVGIYIGNDQFVHASTERTGVITSSLSSSGYTNRYVSASRFF